MSRFSPLSALALQVFFKDQFLQAPLAFVLLTGLAFAQGFARPFDDTSLDYLQSISSLALLFYVFVGQLLNTTLGRDTTDEGWNWSLNTIFLFAFITVTGLMFRRLAKDMRRRHYLQEVTSLAEEHDLQVVAKNYKVYELHKWLESEPSEVELEFFNLATEFMRTHTVPPHMWIPYIQIGSDYPSIFLWLLEDSDALRKGFPEATLELLSSHNPPPEETDISKDFFNTSLARIMSFIYEDMTGQHHHDEADKQFTHASNPIRKLFRVEPRARVLHGLLSCTREQRVMFRRALQMIVYRKGLDAAEQALYKPLIDAGKAARAQPEATTCCAELHATLEEVEEEGEEQALVVQQQQQEEEAYAQGDSDGTSPRISLSQWEALSGRMFLRYDLDGSNSINSLDEFKQLTTNLAVKLSSQYGISAPDMNKFDELVACHYRSMTLEQYQDWYLGNLWTGPRPT